MTAQRKIALVRLVTLILLCLPAAELGWRWWNDGLGARPVTLATHITGDWAVIFLLASLALTPARALFDWQPLVLIRRRVGVACALYALAHLGIYIFDQKWDLVVVALEIAKRFYLTIGFAALLMLSALAITSTDGWQRRLKRNWKRLHRLVYPAALIALLHFFIQSKVNVGEATIAAGLFVWLMLWRVLPPRLRTSHPGLLLLAAAATLSTLAFELAWYYFVNNVEPMRILRADINPDLFPRPIHKVALAALAIIPAVALRRFGKRLFTRRYIQPTISPS
jgi:sulfoxide reductase heme-binding subunit YedZ